MKIWCQERRSLFVRGAMLLAFAGFAVKLLGAVNRIVLSRILGGEGIGLYQMAYPVYQTALCIATAGIPVAVSIMVAEKKGIGDFYGAWRIFRIASWLMLLPGIAASLLLYYGAGWCIEQELVRDERAYYAIIALSPAIFIVTVLASLRGFFQGIQLMRPVAVSQIVEQLFRVAVMLVLVVCFLPYGLEFAAGGASFGAAAGGAAAAIVLVYYYRRYRSWRKMLRKKLYHQESTVVCIKRLIKLALPVSLANLMLPLTANIDLLVVPRQLEQAGLTVAQATEQYGYLTGMAASLVSLPTIMTAALSASLVPAAAELMAQKRYGELSLQTARTFRLVSLVMLPCCTGLYVLAEPVAELLYAAPRAGTCIEILAAGVFMLGIGQVTTGILQGMGHTMLPFINMTAAAGAKLYFSYYLTCQPEWGIRGAAWATNADFGTAALLNLAVVWYYTGCRINILHTLKILGCCLMMGWLVSIVYDELLLRQLTNGASTLLAIIAGVISYSGIVILTGEAKTIRL